MVARPNGMEPDLPCKPMAAAVAQAGIWMFVVSLCSCCCCCCCCCWQPLSMLVSTGDSAAARAAWTGCEGCCEGCCTFPEPGEEDDEDEAAVVASVAAEMPPSTTDFSSFGTSSW